MAWIKYVGPSPSRMVPGVGNMVRDVAVEVTNDAKASELLESPAFAEGKAPAKKSAPPTKDEE